MPISISKLCFRLVAYKAFQNKRPFVDSAALVSMHDEYLIGYFFGLS